MTTPLPNLKLLGRQPDLRLTTNGKQIILDPVQVKLMYTMTDQKNIEKTTVLCGPEGSGKTIFALEIAKRKLIHYMKKLQLSATEAKEKLRVIICVSYTGEDRVPLLLKQLKAEANDIEFFCKVDLKPVHDLEMKSPALLGNKLKDILDLESKTFVHTIVMMDELYPGFTTNKWQDFQSIKNVDFVLALRHAFNDGLLEKEFNVDVKDFLDEMEKEGVYPHKNTVFCHLRQSYRCSQELLELTYYMLIHSPPEEQLYKQKSFFHLPESISGKKPLWLEVHSVESFIDYTNVNQDMKDLKDVMVVYEPDSIKDDIQILRGHCLGRKWKICPSTSVMGSEAKIVIIYDMKTIHFEALSRAVFQLIFVTTHNSQ